MDDARGESRFDALGEAERSPRLSETHCATARIAEQPLGVVEPRLAAGGIEEGAVHRLQAAVVADGGEHRGMIGRVGSGTELDAAVEAQLRAVRHQMA